MAIRMHDGLTDPVVHQHAVRQSGECIVCGQVPQLFVGHLETLRPGTNDLLQSLDLPAYDAFVLPFASQCVGALHDFDRLEWFFHDEQLVGMVQARDNVGLVVVGMG